MDQDPREHFEAIISLARVRLTDARVIQNDVTANRAILQVQGRFRRWDVRIKEIRAPSGNLYSYYLLESGVVIVGFDNYSDVRIVKARFGRQYKRHVRDLIPHRHGYGKKTVVLSAELTAREFLENLERYLET
jgi:hypothetical protein